jgi:Tfp pilus assembly protein PilF
MSPTPHVKYLLAHATSLYASGDLAAAKSAVYEIIQSDSTCVQGYTLLSHVCEDMGLDHDAANAYFSAALTREGDQQMWARAARLSRDVRYWQQAIKSYDR